GIAARLEPSSLSQFVEAKEDDLYTSLTAEVLNQLAIPSAPGVQGYVGGADGHGGGRGRAFVGVEREAVAGISVDDQQHLGGGAGRSLKDLDPGKDAQIVRQPAIRKLEERFGRAVGELECAAREGDRKTGAGLEADSQWKIVRTPEMGFLEVVIVVG